MEKIVLTQVVLVEGRYDQAKLESLLDATIVPVHGFSIFTDEPLQHLIQQYAARQGVLIWMDSDAAGFKIRGFLTGILPPQQVTHVYTPDIYGKEKRKQKASKEGKLGVEGMSLPILREALEKAGVLSQSKKETKDLITKADLYHYGLSGGGGSKEQRELLLKKLEFPQRMSTNRMLSALNTMFTKEEFELFFFEH